MPKRTLTVDELNTAKSLYLSGASYQEIGDAINIHPNNVSRTLRRVGVDPSRRSEPAYPIDETFFDTWTQNSAYTVGYFIADGAFEKHHTFRMYSNDFQLLVDMANAMKLNRPPSGPYGNNYRLDVNSRILISKLRKIVGKQGRKLGDVRLPQVPDVVQRDLLRGFFDGDGHIGLKPDRGAPLVRYTNTSLLLLRDVSRALTSFGIPSGEPYCVDRGNSAHKLRYDLEFRNYEVLHKFHELFYGHDPELFLARKRERFNNQMELGL